MQRQVLRFLGLCLLGHASLALAQPGPTTTDILRRNPGLVQLVSKSSTEAQGIAEELRRILLPTPGTRRGPVRDELVLTQAERGQLTHNPDFGRAYALRPDYALYLLRQMNDALASR